MNSRIGLRAKVKPKHDPLPEPVLAMPLEIHIEARRDREHVRFSVQVSKI
jgi:hypothetical protein